MWTKYTFDVMYPSEQPAFSSEQSESEQTSRGEREDIMDRRKAEMKETRNNRKFILPQSMLRLRLV